MDSLELIKHIDEIIMIIQNDCEILLDEHNREEYDKSEISQLYKGISHIQGLCNGLKIHIDKFNE